MPGSSPRLEMRAMCKRFGATVALDDVGLAVNPGEVLGLVGENGAGKSTLMKVLSGAIRPEAGSMKLDGKAFLPKNPLLARRLGVAMIYQELSLCPHLTVEENIALGVEPALFGIISQERVRQRATGALEQLNHPEIHPLTRVESLSPAARQLVEIGRAIATGCRVLVLDEPTSSLSENDVFRLFELIRRLRKNGLAVVYISHFIEEIKEVTDSFLVLRDGKTVGSGKTADAGTDEIVRMMTGRSMERMYPRSSRKPGDAAIEIEGLAGVVKPSSANLVLRRGEVFGIAGLVGAGRTELLRTVFGLDPVVKGRIRVGAYIGPASPANRWKQGVGLLSEDRKEEGLAVSMNVADNLTLSRLQGMGPGWIVLPSKQNVKAEQLINMLDIRCLGPSQQVAELSGGNQQKVALARLLHHDVDVLLLDEPTRGIDVGSKTQIYQLIDGLTSGKGGSGPKAVLMVSSYLPELLGVCDRVAVMCRGRLGKARPAKELNEHMLMIEATGQKEKE